MLSARALSAQNMAVRAVRIEAHGVLDAEQNFSLITNSLKKKKQLIGKEKEYKFQREKKKRSLWNEGGGWCGQSQGLLSTELKTHSFSEVGRNEKVR